MKELVDRQYPQAECIRNGLDPLSTHTAAALYNTFEPGEARRILGRLEFHYVPKHASWLNMVETEMSMLKQQCLARRIAKRETLEREIALWHARRNQARPHVFSGYSPQNGREKNSVAFTGQWRSFVMTPKKTSDWMNLSNPLR